jgi:phosphoglycerol transferase MdoB-like AlkP superfamily enzyme
MMVEKPEGYSSKAVAEITDQYTSDSVEDTEYKTPNVIVIMDEAFADLQSVGTFETNEEVMPFYRSLTENTVKGFAYVSVFGGQTANSEFEFLTGDSKAFLPSGSTPYQLYIKDYVPSLTGNLGINNYQGMLAMHPYNASGYNRVSVYQNLGFADFITMEDFTEPTLVRNFISDSSDFQRIIQEYEQAKQTSDAPFYLFNVTMQNHSAYDTAYDNLPDTIQITTESCQNADAQRYLNLIHLSDAALQELLTYFEQTDDPTVVVMFGDHEPGLSNSFYESIMGRSLDSLTDEESMELYKVPFLIWANYDIEEQYIEKTSLNYLQSIMLDVTGMKKSGYNKYLLDLMKEVPAMNVSGYFGADGLYYDVDDTESPYYDSIQKYNILEYNHLFDSKREDAFFELQSGDGSAE